MVSLSTQDLLRIALRRKWWILLSIVVWMPLAVGLWTIFPKTYKSTAIVTIDSPKVSKDYVKGLGGGEGARTYEDPAVAAMQQILLSLTNKSVLLPVLEDLKPYPDKTDETIETQMKRLRKAIIVAKPKDGIGIGISYLHSDPQVAQAVTALLVVKLQEDNSKRREGLIGTTTEFLAAELNRINQELEAKEQTISDFKRTHIGELPDQMEVHLRSLDRLQADLTTSTESLNRAGERLADLEKTIRDLSDTGPVGVVLTEKSLRMGDIKPLDLRGARLVELKQKLNELLGVYKESYPDVGVLREEIRRLESEALLVDAKQSSGDELVGGKVEDSSRHVRGFGDPFLKELMRERNEVKTEIAFLKQKQTNTTRQIKELEFNVQRIPATEQRLAVLLRDYEHLKKGYQSLLDKQTNARIVENFESRQFGEQYRIIEPANFPANGEPPTLIHFLIGGFVMGCTIGLGGTIGIELLKPGFRRPEEVERHLDLPVIATIPRFEIDVLERSSSRSRALLTGPSSSIRASDRALTSYGYRRKWRGGSESGNGSNKSIGRSHNFHLPTKWEPGSILAEQYRVAATRLLLMAEGKKNVVTLVASSIMGEGKTTTAVNLAYVLAHDLKKPSLLIDCDFKRPMVHEYLDIPVGPGLSEAEQGVDSLENCIHHYDGSPLSVLPCGDSKVRPTSIAGIQYVRQILPELRFRYDHVVLDGPPILTLADVNILSAVADEVIFVVRTGVASPEMVLKAVKQLSVHRDAIGVVLTQAEIEFAPYMIYETGHAIKNS